MRAETSRRSFVTAAALLGLGSHVQAGGLGRRPVDLLVSYAAGGTADNIARIASQRVRDKRDLNVVVINRPGGGGLIMQRALKLAKPDGNTIGLCTSNELTFPLLEGMTSPYTLADFTYVASIAQAPNCLVGRPGQDLKSLDAWRTYARSKGGLSIGINPMLSKFVSRLAADLGVSFVPVPFKGGPEALQQVIAGNLDFAWSSGSHVPFERAGTLTLFLALTSARLLTNPNVPTARELGSSLAAESRFLVVASSEMPEALIAEWSDTLREAMTDPETSAVISDRGLIPEFVTGKPLLESLRFEARTLKAALI